MHQTLGSAERLYPALLELPLGGLESATLLGALRPQQGAIWESAPEGQASAPADDGGRWAYLALRAARTVRLHGGELTVTSLSDLSTERTNLSDHLRDPLASVALLLEEGRAVRASPLECRVRAGIELPPFLGGLIGFIGYDTGRYFEKIAGADGSPTEPDLYFQEVSELIAIDRSRSRVLVIVWPDAVTGPAYAQAAKRAASLAETIEQLEPSARAAVGEPDESMLPHHRCKFSSEEFQAVVRRAKEYIAAGDVFQVVLSNRFDLDARPNPLELYALLRLANPSPFHFYIDFDTGALVGASPELMLRGRPSSEGALHLAMRLVAGTYPRDPARSADECIADLLADEKERAEHIMLVDHCRNDLGRVGTIGSVRVSDLCTVERYRDVFHLVSQVSARLRPEESTLSALRAAFPIATLTGTPKIRAMEIIAELEGPSRGLFGGSMMLLGYDGFIESAVIIRSAVLHRDGTTVRAGAGIVHDSDPEREFYECFWKAKTLMHTISRCREAFQR